MITGTTKSGFKFKAEENNMDNMELVDALADLDSGNTLAISEVCKLILGEDMRKKLYDHVRTEDGRVPTVMIERELMEIIEFFNKGKKSSSSPT